MLVKKFTGYLFFDFINKVVPFIISPYIAYSLDLNELGWYTTKLLIYNVLIILFGSGLNSFVMVVLAKNSEEEALISRSHCYQIYTISFLIFSIVSTLVYLFNSSIISFQEEIFLISFCSYIYVMVQNQTSVEVYNGNIKRFGFMSVVFPLLILSSVLICNFLFHNLDDFWLINSFLYLSFFVLLIARKFIIIPFAYLLKITPSFSRALRYGTFQIPHLLSGWVKLGVDRFILAYFLTIKDVGEYSLYLQFALILSALFQSINKVVAPYVMTRLRMGVNIRSFTSFHIIALLVPIFFSIVLFSLFSYSFDIIGYHFDISDFKPRLVFTMFLAYGVFGSYMMVVNVLFFLEKTKSLAMISVLSALIHTLISYMMIHKYGLEYASIGLLVGMIMQFSGVFILSIKSKEKIIE